MDDRAHLGGADAVMGHAKRRIAPLLGFVALAVSLGACGPAMMQGRELPALDTSDVGLAFSPDFLVADADFEDGSFLSAAAIQDFFEKTPYGAASFLATYTERGRRASDLLAEVAAKHRVSALWLLARLERDGALLAARRYPAEAKDVEYVFSYGCSGRVLCDPTFGGLGLQLDALAGEWRRALADIRAAGISANGFAAGTAASTLDGVVVTPASTATAALYAVEPIARGLGGGHEQTWRIYRVYAAYAGYVPVENPSIQGPAP